MYMITGTSSYINIFAQGSRLSDPAFTAGSIDITGLTFVGSSTNTVDFVNAVLGGSLTRSFNNLDLSPHLNETLYAVVSTTNTADSFVGASFEIANPGSESFNGLAPADSAALFGGTPDAGRALTFNVTLVPEPSSSERTHRPRRTYLHPAPPSLD
ncbi:hypothetical protein [Rubritalea tangerina]|uniref:Uncharacterized protein n=1 Tax=Rubritalea tangerina TaxID=430798 RepID=A0ABW4ZB59_9BACT